MTTTASKRQKVVMPGGIRQKLVAALCMLLVASIMMVSSTYAWFTLSTAPEVTGITTNVGANGNLEIVLLNVASKESTADDLGILSSVGDSSAVRELTLANVTWGNIVDLNDPSYGLSSITMLPARAGITGDAENGYALSDAATLYGPTYGYDGRVVGINKLASLGSYSYGAASFVNDAAAAGVSALGVSGGLTARVSSYRSAKSLASSNASAALAAARNSLSANGQALADLMVALAMGQDDCSSYIPGLKAMVTGMETANAKLGDAIRQAALAYALSAANSNELTDADVNALVAAAGSAIVDGTLGATLGGVTLPADINTLITLYTNINASLTDAGTKLNGLGATVTAAEAKAALTDLVNPDMVTVSGKTLADGKQQVMDAAVADFMGTGSVPIVLGAGSGVYDLMAQAVGSFTVSSKVHIDYSGISADVNATISTESGTNYANKVAAVLGGLTEPANDAATGAVEALDDLYGYQLDFGFRTNASGSNLKLQTAAAQRVYSDSEAAGTQGGGSYMEFTSDKLNKDEVLALMSTARVLFVDASDSNKILAVGALDIVTATDNATNETTYTPGDVTAEHPTTGYFTADATDANKGIWNVPLYLHNFTLTASSVTSEPDILTLGAKKTGAAGGANLCLLQQNVAKKISVVVYFDGDLIDNSMVANATKSMTGKLNLQFSSSAPLVAMKNSGLLTAKEVTYTQVAAAGGTMAQGGFTGTVNTGYTIYEGSDGNYYYSQDGGTTYTRLTAGSPALTVVTGP